MLSSSSLKERGTFPIHHRQGVFTFLPAWDVISNGGGAGFQEEPTLSFFFFLSQEVKKSFFLPFSSLGKRQSGRAPDEAAVPKYTQWEEFS